MYSVLINQAHYNWKPPDAKRDTLRDNLNQMSKRGIDMYLWIHKSSRKQKNKYE